MSGRISRRVLPLALVHHANQYLTTNEYENREGISELVEGYATILGLHEQYRIPANLHLSGTLIETIAWHYPGFLRTVRSLMEKGLVSLVGGVYAENIMTIFPSSFNRRQLDEVLWLYEYHLGCPPAGIKVLWVPERVWNTDRLAPVLATSQLANGGYRFVLLDDRLLYATKGRYQGSPRSLFDSSGPYRTVASPGDELEPPLADPDSLAERSRLWRIARASGMVVVPISADLRYWLPPKSASDLRRLEETVRTLVQGGGEDTVLVYADDLEKTAGVGPWSRKGPARFETFLRWVAARSDVTPILLPQWLDNRLPAEERPLSPGTYYELAQRWDAGEDYRRWWGSFAWAPYRRFLEMARDVVYCAESGASDHSLISLAWKHLLASTYETAWHDTSGHSRTPAHWARALASHARACLPVADAALWFGGTNRRLSARDVDIDEDGEAEVILANEHLYAVVAPRYGGRLIYLFSHTSRGGVMIVGNPTDDWNWQEELNQYMVQPPNHPGALADLGAQNDRYRVSGLGVERGYAYVEMVNVERGSPLFGTRKRLALASGAAALTVCYHLRETVRDLVTEACFSPDYYRLLREGRGALRRLNRTARRGAQRGDVSVWLGLATGEETAWGEPETAEVGHGLNVRLEAHTAHFHLAVGCGRLAVPEYQTLLRQGAEALHALARGIESEIDISSDRTVA